MQSEGAKVPEQIEASVGRRLSEALRVERSSYEKVEVGMETRYVTNENGERVGVILSIEEYERLIEALEDFEDIRAAQETLEAIERGEDELIPFEEALEEMRRNRKAQGL